MADETPEAAKARRARRAAKSAEAEGDSKVPSRDEAKKKIQNGVESAQNAMSSAGGFVTPVVDGVVDALGGVSELVSCRG
jgi:chorismate synthase